ncbi:Alpha-L-rhamnosidase [Lachnellula subtilissima]|uniref:Alpha-L-rhamnosidase n=1 Tax=Lachnellula subtilissima TaxID=602034 RepID=A0A8H8S1B9_9HELO|nr:Alpha-L-rhamnosidase [Lachnellula subtilissima]
MSSPNTALLSLVAVLLLFFTLVESAGSTEEYRKVCTVRPCRDGSDDAPAVLRAFEECGNHGRVEFLNETYHIESIMNISGLNDVAIDLKGTLLWGTNITYWLNNSMPMGYQNQSTAWILGGDRISFQGHGYGTIDGNGQVWYDFIKGASNYPRRPHAITVYGTTNSVFEGLRFVQSQMWTMTVIHSSNVLLQDIYVSSISNSSTSTVNTDGCDTIYANNITFHRWEVHNGDDGISPKANSTNILVTNSTFIGGAGLALGSIGQYKGVFETIENFTARDCVFINTTHSAYLKTWTGEQVGYPPNGGGGGIGYIKNVLLSAFTLFNVRQFPMSITQCINFAGAAGNCSSSLFAISNLSFLDIKGTVQQEPIVSLQCSAVAPCVNITVEDVSGLKLLNGTRMRQYDCDNTLGTLGFNCTGHTCGMASGDGTC